MVHAQISSEWLTCLWIKDNTDFRQPENLSAILPGIILLEWAFESSSADTSTMRCMAKWTYPLMSRLAPYYIHECLLFTGIILSAGCHCLLSGTHLPEQTEDENSCSFLAILLKWVMCELPAYTSAACSIQSEVHTEKVRLLCSTEPPINQTIRMPNQIKLHRLIVLTTPGQRCHTT